MHGYRDRVYYMDISEEDVIMGTHVDRAEMMVGKILASHLVQPRAFFIFSTCIDDLLGSDYEFMTKRLTEHYGIPFVEGHMNPISMTSATPPPSNLQRSIYQILLKEGRCESRSNSVNIIGNFVPVDAESELYTLLDSAGISEVRQMCACKTYDEFLLMRSSSYNIMLKTYAELACQDMAHYLEIPFHLTGLHYLPARIADEYDQLSAALGRTLLYQPAMSHCEKVLNEARTWLNGLSVAVGANLNGSTFEIALLLARLGAHISYLVVDDLSDDDRVFAKELAAIDGQIPVYCGTAPLMSVTKEAISSAKVAIGFDAAKLSPTAKLLPLGVDIQPFGFQAADNLVEGIHSALSSTVSAYELLYERALVI
jgi:nitrogenase molybdenum-cofactor synthesis protein NifE